DIDVGPTTESFVQISNVSTGTLNILNVLLNGVDASEFLITPNGSLGGPPFAFPLAIASSQTGTLTVAFDPNSVGDKTAILEIDTDDPVTTNSLVTLTGRGVDQQIDVSPPSLDFLGQ